MNTHSSGTQLRGINVLSTVERIDAIRSSGRVAVLVRDNEIGTLEMARALGCAEPCAGIVFAVSSALGAFVREMVETACCLSDSKAGYVALYTGKADVV